MMLRLVQKMVQEICVEQVRVNELARTRAADIVANAIKIQRGIQKPIEDIRDGVLALQEA